MYCFVDHPTDPSAATWALQSAKLNTPRCSHSSIVFQRRIWVAGGEDSNNNFLSSVEVFDATVNKWESAPVMVRKRHQFKLVVVENELYAVGGELHTNNLSIEKLSKFSGAWQVVAEINESRWGCGAAAVGSKIYIFGGFRNNYKSTWNAFDVGTGQWAIYLFLSFLCVFTLLHCFSLCIPPTPTLFPMLVCVCVCVFCMSQKGRDVLLRRPASLFI